MVSKLSKMKWMNLPEEHSSEDAKFVILPIEYENDLTYRKGASKGPEEIIKASQYLEYYDEEFDCEAFENGIKLLDYLKLKEKSPKEMIEIIASKIAEQKNKFVISLGGDHAVTIGIVKGLEVKGLKRLPENGSQDEEFSVIQFDAHADFRDSWNGSELNHACVAKQISKNHNLLQIGIRSMDIDEMKQIKINENAHQIKAREFSLEKIEQLLSKLKPKVYITIDVDVFDPSFIRNTGTPEPGGLTWQEIIDALKLIFHNKEVIGTDIVEFSPNTNYQAEAYSLAKLVYKLMSLQKLTIVK